MQVILKTDIENLGKLGDLVQVKPGYARNYLIPKNLAMQASSGNLKRFEQERNKLEKLMEKQRFEAQDLASKLEQTIVTIPVRVGENEKLYGSVTANNISEALYEKGFDIDKKKIELENPIRALGDYHIGVKIYPNVQPKLHVQVIRHEEEHN
jgi:large subunit ribosomal protein L9